MSSIFRFEILFAHDAGKQNFQDDIKISKTGILIMRENKIFKMISKIFMSENEKIAETIKSKEQEYSFCETLYAGPYGRWHIRKLSDKGQKLGGGADTTSICGTVVSWDLKVPITYIHLQHCCPECAKGFAS